MSKNYYVSGQWNVICDVCGVKHKAGESKQRWDGFIVCPPCFEHRHPQDFVKARTDKITVPFTRPRPLDAFLLTQGLTDFVDVSDSDGASDYLVILSDYFAQDYMVDGIGFKAVLTYQRDLTDSTTVQDDVGIDTSKGFSDSVTISETIDVTRMLLRSVNDSVTPADSGVIFLNIYIDDTYFLSDYVGTNYTF